MSQRTALVERLLKVFDRSCISHLRRRPSGAQVRGCLVARATLGVHEQGGNTKFLREPTAGVVVAIATIGIASAILAVLLRLASDHSGPDPGLQAALLDWIILAFIVSGLVAWWRRPENRFGPLMIAAGLALCLSCCLRVRRSSEVCAR
jgi:hypothetical protein